MVLSHKNLSLIIDIITVLSVIILWTLSVFLTYFVDFKTYLFIMTSYIVLSNVFIVVLYKISYKKLNAELDEKYGSL